MNLVHSMFPLEIANAISSINITPKMKQDSLLWILSKLGDFFFFLVKTAYRNAHKERFSGNFILPKNRW